MNWSTRRSPLVSLTLDVKLLYTPKVASIMAPNPGSGVPQPLMESGLSTLDAVLSLLNRHSDVRYVIALPNVVFGTTSRSRIDALAEVLDIDPPDENGIVQHEHGATVEELQQAVQILFRLTDPDEN